MRSARTGLLVVASLAALVSRADAAAKDAASRSRAHFERGAKHYDLAEYEPALAEFKEAYQTKPDPAYLFNIAQCYRLLGQVEDAIVFYKNYLRKSPDARNREDVEKRLVELEAARKDQGGNTAAADTTAKEAPVPAPPAAPLPIPEAGVPAPGSIYPQPAGATAGPEVVAIPGEEASVTQAEPAAMPLRKLLGWTAVGLGVAGGVASLTAYLISRSALDKADELGCTDIQCVGDAGNEFERAQTAMTVSNVTGIAGGVFLVGGIVLILTAPSSSVAGHEVAIVPVMGPGLAQLALTGRF